MLTSPNIGFPPQWVDNAIPYKLLKKCLKKVQKELSDLGLEPDTLSMLLALDHESPILVDYKLGGIYQSKTLRLEY